MGVIDVEIRFRGAAPEPSAIANAVSNSVGLTAKWVDRNDIDGGIHDYIGEVRLEQVAGAAVELHAYRTGAVRQFIDEVFADDGDDHHCLGRLQGLNEVEGTQSVYVRGYLLSDPTLLVATVRGLEALGGSVAGEPFPAELLASCPLPVTVEELEHRLRLASKKAKKVAWWNLALLILVGPIWLLSFIASLPWVIWRACRAQRETV